MGIEIIRLGGASSQSESQLALKDFASPVYHDYSVRNPDMLIWLMVAFKDRPLAPWWGYDQSIDSDIEALNQTWSISSAQSLFDCLFLSQIKKFSGPNFYAIFPGNIKTDGWTRLRESDKATFLKGQGCIYHLQGDFDAKLNINWVPFWQPQSLVKDPSFANFWRLFLAAQSDDNSNCISFFSLSSPARLPEAINLLIGEEESRSEKLCQVVDWFGFYSSPLQSKYSPCSAIYTKHSSVVSELKSLQHAFTAAFAQAKQDLVSAPVPSTVMKFLSRQIAL